ncbi:hypothetical protein CBR_g21845 [Chara braunii]|uniref:Reverse transcriptase RNase H-like domain-containing protein n=1 Tax=Chara braunii TaxID=69332 RepID=A0A388JUW0_CHABU|nr:hypothetical protein CBR_g21845 [Chara braunii]|eukprot:GBG61502.1 hypothetical protein CBR_g21845 [Chara braunii]
MTRLQYGWYAALIWYGSRDTGLAHPRYWYNMVSSDLVMLIRWTYKFGLHLAWSRALVLFGEANTQETDARPTALGGVLIQKDLNEEERPLRFESRTLNTVERNYSQFKRETLTVLHFLRIFRNYLFGSRFVLKVDPTALAGSMKNYAPSDPTIARWLTYIWMFDFELERIPGNKNRADGLSRVDWDKNNQGVIEDAPPVDGFLDSEEDVRLHINSWALAVGNYVTPGQPVWLAPPGHPRRPDLVLKPYIEEDSWGRPGVEWMMELALAGKYELQEDLLTIESGALQVGKQEKDLETDLTFEELLDLRARQIGAIEDRIEEAASRTADSRTKDKLRWDKMARVRKEPFKVGDVVLLYDSSLEKQWSRKLDKRWLGPYRVTRCGEHGAYQIEKLNGTAWKDWVSSSRLKKFVARDEASERRGVEKKRREPETEARGTFEQGASPGAQREERRKEHKSHRHERAEGSDGSDAPPQPAQREMDGPMPDAEPDIPHEPHTQELREEPSVDEKELDREERAARELEIRTQLRKKNLAELHERMQQGKAPEEVEDRKGKGTCTQEEDPPLFSEVWMGFDKLMDATGRSGGQHQEMGVKLVSTDLLNLRSVMREGFAAARTSDQKIGDRLTKVAQEAYGQRVDWERKAGDPKRELDRQGKELAAVKADMERVSTENEVVRQVNQTLNKVTDALRAYLCAQITFFQVKETEWEKRIRDLEAKCAQQAPTRVMDWTEVQKFEIREQPVEEVFKREKEIEKADQQEGEEIPLIDKEMLEQPGVLVEKGAEVAEFEWRLPAGLTRGHEPAVPQEGPPVEAMRVEEAPPTIRKETVGQQEGQESVGQTMAETEQRVDLRDCQESIMLQEVPVVTDLRGVQGSWATSSGPSDGLVSS